MNKNELVYLWVNNYRGFKKQEFNFSNKFNITFNFDENTLKIGENENVENKCSDNVSYNCLVGKNGSGKSSILSILKYGIFPQDECLYFVLIYDQNKGFSCKGSFECYERSDIKISLDKGTIENSIKEQGYLIGKSSLHNIYFSKSTSMHPEGRSDIGNSIANISDEYLFDKYSEDIQRQYNHTLTSFKQLKDMHKDEHIQHGLLAFYKNKMKFPKDWEKPDKLFIQFDYQYIGTAFSNTIEDFKDDKGKYENYSNLNNLYPYPNIGKLERKKYKWQYFIKHIAILNFVVQAHQGAGKEVYSSFINNIFKDEDFTTLTNPEERIDNYIKYFSRMFIVDDAEFHVPNQYFAIIQDIINKFEFFSDSSYKDDSFRIDINDDTIDNIVAIIKKHKECTATVAGFLSLELSPRMSDGHTSFFNIFAKLHMALNTPANINRVYEGDTILLLLDEIDNYLHPEWKRLFISILTEFLKENYSQYCFQIILTTHSPFMLSDLKKEQIIFLDNKKQIPSREMKQTFGANIHTLLSDAFFMKSGMMGQYAKGQINNVIAFLNGDNTDMNTKGALEIIKHIGEPILKSQLENKLNKLILRDNIEKKVSKEDIIEDLISALDDDEEMKQILKDKLNND